MRRQLRRTSLLPGFIPILALLLAPLPSTAQQPPSFALPGRVLDGITDAPIEGALVRVLELDLTAVSDHEGFFTIPGLRPGRFTFVTIHDAFHQNEEASTVAEGAALFVRLLPRALPAAWAGATHGIADLQPGTRVRVLMTDARRSVVATILEAKPDTLMLGRPELSPVYRLPLAIAEIQRIEISRGRRSLTAAGIVSGAILGLAVVVARNGVVGSQCFRSCPDGFPIVAGAGLGAVLGGVGFTFVKRERWAELSLPDDGPGP